MAASEKQKVGLFGVHLSVAQLRRSGLPSEEHVLASQFEREMTVELHSVADFVQKQFVARFQLQQALHPGECGTPCCDSLHRCGNHWHAAEGWGGPDDETLTWLQG